MTNLPISSNNPPSPTTGAPVDATLSRSDPSAAASNATSPANGPVKDQPTLPFSALLKYQIGGIWETGINTEIVTAATDQKIAKDAITTAKNAQDQAISQNDQAGSLVAMMLQIPVAERGQKPHLTAKNDGIDHRIADNVRQSSDRAGMRNNAPTQKITPDSTSHLTADAAKQVVIAAGSAAHHHTIPSQTKVDNPVTTTAGLNNVITGNTPANIAQTVTTPVGSNGWPGEFSQKIVWISNQKNQSAELHLNPPDLGPLNVLIKMSDNKLTAQFTSQHSAVRDAIENALPKLREVLAENNIMLGNATVSDQTPRDRGGDGYTNQGSGSAAQREISYNASEAIGISPITTQSAATRRHNGMLDTFA